MELSYRFDPKATYLLACSYGSDSMALLDILRKMGVRFVVCFVNYHTSPSNDVDQQSLTEYCLSQGLTLEILDTAKLPDEQQKTEKEEFKDWARSVRYRFFREMAAKHKASSILVAHVQDDLIETYLLQKQQKKSQISHYGFSEVANVEGLIVIRPLLAYSKADLIGYDQENHVPYSVNQNSIEDKVNRDTIRTSIVDKLSEIDRANIVEEMNAANSEATSFMKGLSNAIDQEEDLNIREIIALDQNEFTETLIKYSNKSPVRFKFTTAQIAEVRKMALAPQPELSMCLADGVYLYKEYDVLTMAGSPDHPYYSYVLKKPGKLSTKEFDLDFNKGAKDRGIHKNDYPLTIRPALMSDNYNVHGFMTPVRRLYIDWKMPAALRVTWPIIVGADGSVLFIPRYQRLDRGNYEKPFTSEFNLHLDALKIG